MIVLVGFMGAGKSTVGRLLADLVGLPFVDTDALVEERAGHPIHEIFASEGEAAFRSIERAVVLEVLDGPEAVVSLGGGAVTDEGVRAALGWANVVHLEASLDSIRGRVADDGSRPLLRAEDLDVLHRAREDVYRDVASFPVATDGRSPDEVAREIAVRLSAAPVPAGAGVVRVALGPRSYDVIVGAGILGSVADAVSSLPDVERCFVVSHPTLAAISERVSGAIAARGLECSLLEVAEGESSKTAANATRLLAELADIPAHRTDVVVAVGGGVVCDLAGFVASTYARGIPVVHVATSLLAQVDAAIGGKTGVNLPQGKNLVGTIHQPAEVICDVDLLATLPQVELRSGLAEVVKYGFIADPDILDLVRREAGAILRADPGILAEIVRRSVAIKATIVAEDETEQGARAFLNYGHTFAHAIEQTSDYAIRHGEAVSLGMMAAAYLARELGRVDDEIVSLHRDTLDLLGLPVQARLRVEDLEAAWMRDKKYRKGLRFVLLSGLGKPESGVEVDMGPLRRAIERMSE